MKAAGVKPNVITYNAAISACEKGGRTDEALELLAEMKALPASCPMSSPTTP